MDPSILRRVFYCPYRVCGTMHCQYCLAKLFIYMNEQEDVIPNQGEPVDGTINLAKEVMDKLKQATYGFDNRLNFGFPDGSKCRTETLMKDEEKLFSIWMFYYPDNDNPSIPNDLYSESFKRVMEQILKKFPELTSYPKEVTDGIKVDMYDTIYYKEGVIHLSEDYLISSAERNVLLHPRTLTECIHHLDNTMNSYYVEKVPTFSGDYSLAMDKAIKKLKTIYKAYSKGTFKGNTYELAPKPTFVVHQRYSKYDKENRIIYPDFVLSISSGWMTINGETKKWTDTEVPEEYKQLYTDLQESLKRKFENFGIKFS